MSIDQTIPGLPGDAAIAVVDGGVGRRGASTGTVILHGGRARLAGRSIEGVVHPFEAEAVGVARAIHEARSLGVRRLRLLLDSHPVGMIAQGYRPGEPTGREASLAATADAAREAGLAVSVRIVQGHAETRDLPSRLNDLAHILAGIGAMTTYRHELTVDPGWIDRLAEDDPRFRPTRTPDRWAFRFPRRRAAHFLGVDVGTVDALVLAGHVSVTPEGLTRPSVAAVYEAAQEMRREAFFGFDVPEGVTGCWDDEISRGWDGRPSLWYHRKSGLRPPATEAADEPGASPVP